uniref:Large ribosomal subunit protein uL22c n=2 Tax=Chroomonas TaxID=3028 RepID=A0A222AIB5_9CRYP|nr:ribosomal protein L22 [Chroomonas placoidea]ASO76114.1 ribosomal protein L22 [Chroomonas placoidea]ASV47596.1 ribosomal protein L22 [Chroomonas mesostigmatica CCMP1168]
MNANLVNTEVKAVAKYIRMSPNKVRRVLNQIRGKSYKEALMLLEFMPYSACKPVLQVLQSAAANAQNNNGMQKSELLVNKAYADQGPVLKRFRPRAQGRGFKIKKPTCHITVYVSTEV